MTKLAKRPVRKLYKIGPIATTGLKDNRLTCGLGYSKKNWRHDDVINIRHFLVIFSQNLDFLRPNYTLKELRYVDSDLIRLNYFR